MKGSSLFFALYLIGSLSDSATATRRFPLIRDALDDDAGSRAEAFQPGYYPERPGGRKRYPVWTENLTDIRHHDIPDWLYLQRKGGDMVGFSVRLSDSVMLVPSNLESTKQVQVKKLEELINFADFDRYEYINWLDRPNKILRENVMKTQVNIELFKDKSNDNSVDEKFVPSHLRISSGGPHMESKKRLSRLYCMAMTYRKIDDDLNKLFFLSLDGYCEDKIQDETFEVIRAPYCHVFAKDTPDRPGKSFEFCPEDNGAPVFCGKGELTFMLDISQDNGCSGSARASRIHRFADEMNKTVSEQGDRVSFFDS